MMHEGHRSRMFEKLENDAAILDHELLEMILFYSIPRVNTNPIAHNLLDKFGSLSGVLNASSEQLLSVEGVGKQTANYFKLCRELLKRVTNEFNGIAVLKNVCDFKNFVVARMRGRSTENLEFYCLDRKGRVLSVESFSNDNENMVEIGMEEVARIFATEKPCGLIVAHNHLSGDSTPSLNDNQFTMQVQVLCSINNVNFYDHCIYASDADVYSYRSTGELDEIKKTFTFENLISEQMNLLLKKK